MNKQEETGDSPPLETPLPDVPRETSKKLLGYVDLLFRWQKKTNLTGARSPEDFYPHIMDCVGAWEVVAEEVWVDVGSGNGLPGIVWACLAPEKRIFLVEGSQKKAAFLQQVVATLQLKEVRVLPLRWESLSGKALEELRSLSPAYVSRGTVSPSGLIKMIRNAPLPCRVWYAFASPTTEREFLTLGEKSEMKVSSLHYPRDLEDPQDNGTLCQLIPLWGLDFPVGA